MPQNVAIFDTEWVCEAVIDTEQKDLPVVFLTSENSILSQLVEQLRTRAAESLQPEKDESGCVTGFAKKEFGAEGYAQAVADECKRAGLRSAVVAADLIPLLAQVPSDARSQVLPEVLYMDPELAREVLARMIS